MTRPHETPAMTDETVDDWARAIIRALRAAEMQAWHDHVADLCHLSDWSCSHCEDETSHE